MQHYYYFLNSEEKPVITNNSFTAAVKALVIIIFKTEKDNDIYAYLCSIHSQRLPVVKHPPSNTSDLAEALAPPIKIIYNLSCKFIVVKFPTLKFQTIARLFRRNGK